MRTLELRLAEDVYYGKDMPPGPGRVGREEWSEFDQARAQVALEFFDQALISGMGGILNPATYVNAPTQSVFEVAAALTLLRFGVRIVGLEADEENAPPNPEPREKLVREEQEG